MTVRVVLNLRKIAERGSITFNTYTNFFRVIVAFHYPYVFQNINYLNVTSLNFKILNMFQLQFFFYTKPQTLSLQRLSKNLLLIV